MLRNVQKKWYFCTLKSMHKRVRGAENGLKREIAGF